MGRVLRARVVVGAAALLAAVLVLLNVSGIAPIPVGPLGNHEPATPDIARSTLNYDQQRTPEYLTPLVENTGPLAATIVRVTPTGASVPGSVEVLGSLPFNSDDRGEYGPDGVDQIMLGIQPDPGPRWNKPQAATGVQVNPKGAAQHEGRAFLVRMTPDPAQETIVLRFDVEYEVGPFHFITTAWGPVGTTVVMCPRDRPMSSSDGCEAR